MYIYSVMKKARDWEQMVQACMIQIVNGNRRLTVCSFLNAAALVYH